LYVKERPAMLPQLSEYKRCKIVVVKTTEGFQASMNDPNCYAVLMTGYYADGGGAFAEARKMIDAILNSRR
jgi:hypothetical protein